MEIIHGKLDYFGNNSDILVTGCSTKSIFIDGTKMTYLLVRIFFLETCMVQCTEDNCLIDY